MVDIHSHVLFGVDDGPATIEESIAMVRAAAATGTTDIVATPHANLKYHYDLPDVQERIDAVQLAVGAAIRIYRGCDFHLVPQHVESALRDPTRYSINGGSYILVEFSEQAMDASLVSLSDLLEAGFLPVITHPERNRFLCRNVEQLKCLVQLGCCVQVTAQSLLGDFGPRTRSSAEAMFEKGLVHIVASDGHDREHRPPVLGYVRRHLIHRYGEEAAVAVLEANPRAVVDNSLLPEPWICPKRQSRSWKFLRACARSSAV